MDQFKDNRSIDRDEDHITDKMDNMKKIINELFKIGRFKRRGRQAEKPLTQTSLTSMQYRPSGSVWLPTLTPSRIIPRTLRSLYKSGKRSVISWCYSSLR
jgi:hypothetical protein